MRGRHNAHVAGHTQVQDGRSARGVDQQVLGTPIDRGNCLAGQVVFHVLADGPAQAALANRNAHDLLAHNVRLYAAAAGLDFG
jgi:predicted aconitase with swiveling domain